MITRAAFGVAPALNNRRFAFPRSLRGKVSKSKGLKMIGLHFQTVEWSNDTKQTGTLKTVIINSVTGESIELEEKDVKTILQQLAGVGTFKPEFVRIGKRLIK